MHNVAFRSVLQGIAGLNDVADRFVNVDGKTSLFGGVGAIIPFADNITVVGELTFEGERFDNADDDVRILGGVNWHSFNRGMLRGAVTVGLSDGAPDAQLTVGYAAHF